MGGPTINYEEMWELAQGTVDLDGGIFASWDFTDGLTKEQFIEKKEREFTGVVIKNGRMLMPELNIV